MARIGKPEQSNAFSSVQMNRSDSARKNIIDQVNGSYRRGRQKSKVELGKNEFLKLLTHQLRHQDPMKPMDQHKFAADLAQFSQLEQLQNLNKTLEDQNPNGPNNEKFMLMGLLGKKIITEGNILRKEKDTKSMPIYFSLPLKAHKLLVQIQNKKEEIVFQEEHEEVPPGQHELSWNGKNFSGLSEPAGEYTFVIKAWDDAMNQVRVVSKISGVIESLDFSGPTPMAFVNGKRVDLRDVKSFSL